MKRLLFLLPLLLMVGCDDKQIQAAKNVSIVMTLTADLLQADSLYVPQLLPISNIIREAKGKMDIVIGDLEKLTPEARLELWNILQPIGEAIRPDQLQFINEISDERIRTGLIVGLSTMRVTLMTFGAVLLFTP